VPREYVLAGCQQAATAEYCVSNQRLPKRDGIDLPPIQRLLLIRDLIDDEFLSSGN
jgi:hypothetical protein